VIALLCYLQHYPSPLSTHCDSPLSTPYNMTRNVSKANMRRTRFSLGNIAEKDSSEEVVWDFQCTSQLIFCIYTAHKIIHHHHNLHSETNGIDMTSCIHVYMHENLTMTYNTQTCASADCRDDEDWLLWPVVWAAVLHCLGSVLSLLSCLPLYSLTAIRVREQSLLSGQLLEVLL